MTAPKQVDFVDGETVVSADFLDRIQEVQAGLATNAALAISGTNVVMNAGSGNDVSAMVIDERMRYVESPQVVSFSGSDSSGSYSIWATTSDTDSNSGFTLVKTLGTTTPTADNFRRVGTVSWDGSALSSLVQLAGYNKHGYMHTLASDPLPAGSVSSTQILDGTITLSDLAASLQQLLVPTGSILPYAGASAPSSYLLCDGSAVSRTTYAALFAALGGAGSPYGAGDGTTTFNVPDLRGRVVAGRDNMGGTAASRLSSVINGSTLGVSGGAERHTLSSSESGMPSHSTLGDGGHTHSVGTVSSDHTHGVNANGFETRIIGISSNAYGTAVGVWADGGSLAIRGSHGHSTGGISANHTHSVTGGSHTHSVSAANASAGHANVQPTLVTNYIIKI
jgi:microcystin-dependent protein